MSFPVWDAFEKIPVPATDGEIIARSTRIASESIAERLDNIDKSLKCICGLICVIGIVYVAHSAYGYLNYFSHNDHDDHDD